ncbi:MAG: M16 family metallopeptidase [Alphaproteobacteria bacterium]
MAKISTLKNGIRVVSQYMPSVSSCSVGVWAPVGARHESPQKSGVSHFIEHMAFKGTARRSAQQIAEEIEAVGGYLNAWTSRSATAWYCRVLKDDMHLAFDIISDILLNPKFAEDELEKERAVVLQEIAQSKDFPDDVLYESFQEACYYGQPLGQNVLGSVESVSSFNQDDLNNWLNEQYLKSDFIIAAAGNIEHEQLVEDAEKYFAHLTDLKSKPFEKALWTGKEHRIEKDLEQIQFILGFQGYAYNHPNYYASSIFSTLFGGGMSSRLFQKVREQEGLAYSIGSFHSSQSDGGYFGIHGATTDENIKKVLELSAIELKKVASSLSEDEIMRAKNQLKASILMSLETVSNRVEQIARQMMVFGHILDPQDVQNRIEAISYKDVLEFIDYIGQSSVAFAAIGSKKSLPYKEDFTKYL